jgi:hypothetical protein
MTKRLFLQQNNNHSESNLSGKGEDTASETVDLPELMTSYESEGIPLPYKCPTCDESFETKYRLFYHELEVHIGITKPRTVQSIKGNKKNEAGKTSLHDGGKKRIAKTTHDEQQPMKVIITEKQSSGQELKEKQNTDKSVPTQVTMKKIWKADAGNKITSTKTLIMKEEKIKIPWKKISNERVGGENKVDEQDDQTPAKTYVIEKNEPQSGEGGYIIDVTNYVLSQSQVNQFLMNDGDR